MCGRTAQFLPVDAFLLALAVSAILAVSSGSETGWCSLPGFEREPSLLSENVLYSIDRHFAASSSICSRVRVTKPMSSLFTE